MLPHVTVHVTVNVTVEIISHFVKILTRYHMLLLLFIKKYIYLFKKVAVTCGNM